MAKPSQPKAKESEESAQNTEFKGNDFVTADQQQGYADLMTEMKNDPLLGKLMLAPDWAKINAVLSYRILRELEKR